MTQRKRLVVVGNGMASHRFCEKVAEQGLLDEFQITVVGEEPTAAYDRVHLTKLFENNNHSSLILGGANWYEERGIELLTGQQVSSIIPKDRVAHTRCGMALPYEKLVLATGSKPFIPPISGVTSKGIFPYRTIEDTRRIREYAKNKRTALVLGGGLLGLEAADALKRLNLTVHVAEFANGLMPRQLNQDGSRLLERMLKDLSLNIHLGKGATSFRPNNGAITTTFNDGTVMGVDIVVVSTGIRPRDELAHASGLLTGTRGGIVINDKLETSDPNIYAIGECALHRGSVYGFVSPAYKMADTLADRLTGKKPTFEGSDTSCRLKLLGIEVSAFGDYLGEGKTLSYKSNKAYRMIILKGDKVVGGTVVGKWRQTHKLQLAVAENQFLNPAEQAKFESDGQLPIDEGLSNWPINAIVCNCMQVSKGSLSSFISQGCSTVQSLTAQTGAGSVCGSCKPLLGQLLGEDGAEAAYVPRGRKLLLATALTGLTLCLLFWTIGALPVPDTVQNIYYQISKLWTDSLYKQISGFSMAGLSLLALGLSLRKRVKKLRLGNYGWWRAAHSSIGVLSIVALVAHTGLSFGENLNLWLMTCFIGLNAAGAVAGLTLAMENRLNGPTSRRIRNIVTKAHIAFFWPYPVLLGYHIYKVYLY